MPDYFKGLAEKLHKRKSQEHLASVKWLHILKNALRFLVLPQAIKWLLFYVPIGGFDLLIWLQTL